MENNCNRSKKIQAWLLVLVWMAVIFSFSAQNAARSSASSGTLAALLARLLGQQNAGFIEILLRKGAHFAEYALLGGLCLRAFWRTLPARPRRCAALAWALSALYAAGDELHQLFVPGRSGQLRDVLLDSAGALCGILLLAAGLRQRARRGSR